MTTAQATPKAPAKLPKIQRPMDEQVAGFLCSIYQVESADKLPKKVVDTYDNLKVASERISASVASASFIFAVVAMSGVRVPVPETSFLDYLREGLVTQEDLVMVHWRTEWEEARYVTVKNGVVKVDIGGQEYDLDPDLVRLHKDHVFS